MSKMGYNHSALLSKVKSAYSDLYGHDPKIQYYKWSADDLRSEYKVLTKKLRFRRIDMNPNGCKSKVNYREWTPPIDIGYRNV